MSKENDATINLGVAVLIALAVMCAIGLTSLLLFKVDVGEQKAVNAAIEERETKLADMKEGMAKERASYRVISKEKGTIQLPLDVAMKVTLKELQSKKPQPSTVPVDPAAALVPTTEEDADAAAGEETTEMTEPAEAEAEAVAPAPAQAEASE